MLLTENTGAAYLPVVAG